jgi:hypothetical protein
MQRGKKSFNAIFLTTGTRSFAISMAAPLLSEVRTPIYYTHQKNRSPYRQ